MRRAWLALALASSLAAAFAAAGDPAKPSDAASAEVSAAWVVRLSEAQTRLATARERAAESEHALTRARHSRYPRGEALDDLVEAAAEAREALATAEAELPELVEQARSAGVEPGVLRRFETDE